MIDDYRFEKYHKIRQLGDEENKDIFDDLEDEIIIEEKIDGANFRFTFHEGKVIFGSRTQQLDVDVLENNNHLKNFRRCIEFVREKIEASPKIIDTADALIFYGECCIRHSMAYDWDKIPPYLGFDIKSFHQHTKKYLDYDKKKELFESLGLELVPLIKRCKAIEARKFTDKDVPISFYPSPSSKNQKAEGVVFKNYSKQLFAKIVREEFKEVNREAFGGSPKFAKADDDRFVLKYCTNPRIDKIIFKLIDEGNKLEMGLMMHLPRRVYDDIWEEHWTEVSRSNTEINMRKIRKLINSRCSNVLKQVMQNNALNEKGVNV